MTATEIMMFIAYTGLLFINRFFVEFAPPYILIPTLTIITVLTLFGLYIRKLTK